MKEVYRRFAAIFAVAAALLPVMSMHSADAANDRPLIFGMNPTPMEWWPGYEAHIWNPVLFDRMQQAGCTVCRVGTGWDQIEAKQGTYDWSRLDLYVDYCLDHNIEPLVLFGGTPQWAMPKGVDPKVDHAYARYPAAEEHAAAFERFVYNLGKRYRGRVRYYEFWNEANGYGWYTALLDPPSYSRADLYVPWMKRAYKALKKGDPTAMMSTTGIDDNGQEGHGANFLRAIYEEGGKGHFDAVADHPYSAGEFDAWKMDGIRKVLDENGDQHVDVWITEFGYPMDEDRFPQYSDYIRSYFDTLSQDKYSYVTIATWHTANEFPWEHGYGLTFPDLSPKPPLQTWVDYPKPARPAITDIKVEDRTPTSARIAFNTNMPARAMLMYGTDRTYGQVTTRGQEAAKEHTVELNGLQPGSIIHFRVRAGAVEHGDAFSMNQTFTTPLPED